MSFVTERYSRWNREDCLTGSRTLIKRRSLKSSVKDQSLSTGLIDVSVKTVVTPPCPAPGKAVSTADRSRDRPNSHPAGIFVAYRLIFYSVRRSYEC